MQHDVIYVTHDDLPGRVRGLTRWSDRTIWVRASLSQVERRALLDALRWSRHPAVVADQLWVTPQVLADRMEHLHPAERHWLARGLSDEHDHDH